MTIYHCPHCGDKLQHDPDGGYCGACDEYFAAGEILDYEDEIRDDDGLGFGDADWEIYSDLPYQPYEGNR